MTEWKLYQRRLLALKGKEVLAYDIGTVEGQQSSVVGPNAVDCSRCKAKAPDACKESDYSHMERIAAMNNEMKRLRVVRDGGN